MASFKEIDAMNKQLKSWRSSPKFQKDLENIAEQFGIDLTASGRISKSKASQHDEAVDNFIEWYRDNIGTKAEFKRQYEEELEEYEEEYGEKFDLGFDEFMDDHLRYNQLLTECFMIDSQYARLIMSYVDSGAIDLHTACRMLEERIGQVYDNVKEDPDSYTEEVQRRAAEFYNVPKGFV